MNRYPKTRHFNNRPSVGTGGGGGGAPGGATNSIQTNNGAGAFAGVGLMTSTLMTLDAGLGTGNSGLKLKAASANDEKDFYKANSGSYSGGLASTNILDIANVPAFVNFFHLEFLIEAIQTSAVAGASGFGFKLIAAFRRDGAGNFIQVGATAEDVNYAFNDTGDVFSGAKTLSPNAGFTNINIGMNLTTAKTFKLARWVTLTFGSN